MKKILITGAQSTGKTTLVVRLAGELSAAGFVASVLPDLARSCPFPIGTIQSEESTLWLLHQQIAEELRCLAADPDFLLCDRGVPDIFGHWLDIIDRDGSTSRRIETLREHLVTWATTYDMAFQSRIDVNVAPEVDGLREAAPQYRLRMELLISDAASALRMPMIPLPNSLQPRCELIWRTLKDRGWAA